MASWVSSYRVDLFFQVQILREAVCDSLFPNGLIKSMKPSLITLAMSMLTGLSKENL